MAEPIPFKRPVSPREEHNARVAARVAREEDGLYLAGKLEHGSPAYVRAARRAGERLSSWVEGRDRGPDWIGALARQILKVDESTPPEVRTRIVEDLVKRQDDSYRNHAPSGDESPDR